MPFDRGTLSACVNEQDPSFFPTVIFESRFYSSYNIRYDWGEATAFVRCKLLCGVHPTALYFKICDEYRLQLDWTYYKFFLASAFKIMENLDKMRAFEGLLAPSDSPTVRMWLHKDLYERFADTDYFDANSMDDGTRRDIDSVTAPPLDNWCTNALEDMKKDGRRIADVAYRKNEARIAISINRTQKFLNACAKAVDAARKDGSHGEESAVVTDTPRVHSRRLSPPITSLPQGSGRHA